MRGPLLDNATKHHDRDKGTIKFTHKDMGTEIEFCVDDDGPGISPEYKDMIFEPFQTLRSRDELESTGMGLFILKNIVEGLGRRIWLGAKSGRGTRIHFTWPKRVG